jgi:hypothetical protein
MKSIYSKEEVDKLLRNTIDTRLAAIESKFIKAEKESNFIEKESYEQKIGSLNREIEELKRNQIKIQSGEFKPFDGVHVRLNKPREIKISFPNPFSEIPIVHVTFGTIDLDQGRVQIEVLTTSKTGFKCRVSTWANNTIYFGMASLAWIAYCKQTC